ncbi:MAG TPA: hypothetical protein VFI65_12435 [Streptosporangiaceae bacterium]|nr:hypothetical protein [Streptosporangiaceae bacterium]
MRRITDEPGASLAHLVGMRSSGNTIVQTYRLTAVSIRRPPEGKAAHTVECAVCKRPVTWTVLSQAGTRRARIRWRLACTGLLAVIAACVFGCVQWHSSGLLFIPLLVALVSLIALSWCQTFLGRECGVRVSENKRWFHDGHSARPVAATRRRR